MSPKSKPKPDLMAQFMGTKDTLRQELEDANARHHAAAFAHEQIKFKCEELERKYEFLQKKLSIIEELINKICRM